MSDARVLSGLGATIAIARVTTTRALRTWSTIGAAMLAALPVLVAAGLHGSHHDDRLLVYRIAELGAMVIAGLVVAGTIGEEFEDRTMTYLWSRPLPRWSLVTGKLAALVPLSAILYAGTLAAAFSIMPNDSRSAPADAAVAAVLAMVGMSAVAAAMATLVPRQALAMTIVYLFIVDFAIGLIPARVQMISISYHAYSLSRLGRGETQTAAAIALVVIAAAWLALALWRVRRIE
jgi:ABC-2 type transport system permease protein